MRSNPPEPRQPPSANPPPFACARSNVVLLGWIVGGAVNGLAFFYLEEDERRCQDKVARSITVACEPDALGKAAGDYGDDAGTEMIARGSGELQSVL